MITIIHRINTIEALRSIPSHYGVEIDVRGYGDTLYLNHDPIQTHETYDTLEDYLSHFNHAFIVFNLKEAGYENRIHDLAKKYNITNYFLLDVEFPYLYRASRMNSERRIAIRYSEAEPIEMAESQMENGVPFVDWVWIDTNTILPLEADVVKRLIPFKTCLVSPDRWGRPEDIPVYVEKIKSLHLSLDAVMTTLELAPQWEILNQN